MKRKINKKRGGFTLIEVLLGITILATAITLATNMYLSAVRSNKAMVLNLKAYYLSQEGLEIVRNIRDTHWMHNLDWMKGAGETDPTALEKGKVYSVEIKETLPVSEAEDIQEISGLASYFPWEVQEILEITTSSNFPAGFNRQINVLPYKACGEKKEEDCGTDFAVIQSIVSFKDGSNEGSVVLEEVLTNWKR